MRLRHLLILPFCWLALCGLEPLAIDGMLPSNSTASRPKPFVRPSQILFGQPTSKLAFEWRLLDVTPEQRAVYLARIRSGREATDDLSPPFAVIRTIDGHYVMVFNYDIIWE